MHTLEFLGECPFTYYLSPLYPCHMSVSSDSGRLDDLRFCSAIANIFRKSLIKVNLYWVHIPVYHFEFNLFRGNFPLFLLMTILMVTVLIT